MENTYNLCNLEASFKQFLLAGNKNLVLHTNTVKNYLSDLRHFIGWSQLLASNIPMNQILSTSTIISYKEYLMKNNVPAKTINRRLSTLRKFCTFCISQGWITENPAKKIRNFGVTAKPQIDHLPDPADILNQFKLHLIGKQMDQNTITSYMETLEQIMAPPIINSQQSYEKTK